jgi:hypothetical protein
VKHGRFLECTSSSASRGGALVRNQVFLLVRTLHGGGKITGTLHAVEISRNSERAVCSAPHGPACVLRSPQSDSTVTTPELTV